eukprot:4786161-Prymnesium_polylepis.1
MGPGCKWRLPGGSCSVFLVETTVKGLLVVWCAAYYDGTRAGSRLERRFALRMQVVTHDGPSTVVLRGGRRTD